MSRGRCHPPSTPAPLLMGLLGQLAQSPTHCGCKATEISLLLVLEARDPSQGVSRATLPPRLSKKPLPSLPSLWGSSAHRDSSPSPLCLHLAYFPRPRYLQISANASQTRVKSMTTKAREQGCPLGQRPQLMGTLGLWAMKELPPEVPQTLCHPAPNCLWCPVCI